MSKLAHGIESILFRARWLLVPLYVGLVGALILLIYRFGLEFVHMFENVADSDAHKFTLDLLALLDLTLLANLILILRPEKSMVPIQCGRSFESWAISIRDTKFSSN